MSDAILRTQDLAVGYRGKALIEHIALQVRRGEIMTLIGPNGAGKSTILKSIIRQLEPLAGTVYIDGRATRSMAERELARSISVVMTDRVHPELMTCADVVATGRYPYTGSLGLLSQGDWAAVRSAMERVDALGLWDTDFGQLSDGQRQRILLARAICQEPEVMVLDEPTSFLDIRYKLELLAILKDLVRDKGMAAVVSLHELDLAQKISDTVVCVSPERGIDRWGPPEEIFAGDYIHRLYGVTRGSFDPLYGSPLRRRHPPGERPGLPGGRRPGRGGGVPGGLPARRGGDLPPCPGGAGGLPPGGVLPGEFRTPQRLQPPSGPGRRREAGPPGGDLTGGLPGEKGKKEEGCGTCWSHTLVFYNPSSSSSHSRATASDGIRLVGPKSADLRSRLAARTSSAPLCLLSPPRPLAPCGRGAGSARGPRDWRAENCGLTIPPVHPATAGPRRRWASASRRGG